MLEGFPIGEVLLLLAGSVVLAFAAAFLTVASAPAGYPVWPIRVYLRIFRKSKLLWGAKYADGRTSFPRREQFLASFVVWFFFFFVLAIMGQILIPSADVPGGL